MKIYPLDFYRMFRLQSGNEVVASFPKKKKFSLSAGEKILFKCAEQSITAVVQVLREVNGYHVAYLREQQ